MFKPITGYEGLYEISPEGRVRNARTTRPIPVKSGRVTLSKNGLPTTVSVKDLAPSYAVLPPETLAAKTSRRTAARDSYGPWANQTHVPRHTGAAGEYLVCAVLERCGVFAVLPACNTAEYDVIGDFGRGYFFTVQVKTTTCATKGRAGDMPTYKFSGLPANQDACDIFAFVALDTFNVVFELAREVYAVSRSFMVVDFEAKASESTINTLQKLYAKQT
jgi:hypothetical protein